MPIDITHIFLAIGLIFELLVLGYVVRVEREVAADLKRTIEAYGAGNLRQGLKIEELIERVRNEMHAERG
ncbi:MAG: hypothetical protein JOZ29_02260 [Deltaproteobacteria bacterium]|nr:hypothetical protein [Deltaproteobacteria bacterium]MBV8451084.1 hypothetical protein [Deltaproteobacteria bacterium]